MDSLIRFISVIVSLIVAIIVYFGLASIVSIIFPIITGEFLAENTHDNLLFVSAIISLISIRLTYTFITNKYIKK